MRLATRRGEQDKVVGIGREESGEIPRSDWTRRGQRGAGDARWLAQDSAVRTASTIGTVVRYKGWTETALAHPGTSF